MPIIKNSPYNNKKPFYFLNSHFETMIPSLFYKVKDVAYQRERLELDDGDFLDLDWLKCGSEKVMILNHGMEGDSKRHYIKRFSKFFHKKGWDILAWNYRSCSGELNRLAKFYSYGGMSDLATVTKHVLDLNYSQVVLVGFSMGGGLVTKYLGTQPIEKRITHGIVFSVSSDVKDSVNAVEKKKHIIYSRLYVNKLKNKLKEKARVFEELRNIPFKRIKTFKDIHQHYTVPHHNYTNIDQFYEEASSGPHIKNIGVPTLMINALNDPILGKKCYPYEAARANPHFFLETPKYGGHLGFSLIGKDFSYMEIRANEFLQSH